MSQTLQCVAIQSSRSLGVACADFVLWQHVAVSLRTVALRGHYRSSVRTILRVLIGPVSLFGFCLLGYFFRSTFFLIRLGHSAQSSLHLDPAFRLGDNTDYKVCRSRNFSVALKCINTSAFSIGMPHATSLNSSSIFPTCLLFQNFSWASLIR